jgi:hypothetical protein
MKLKTIGSIALLAVSSAALAQMTSPSGRQGGHNTTMNSSSHMNSSMPMNSSDETMMNGMSTPDGTRAPNAF